MFESPSATHADACAVRRSTPRRRFFPDSERERVERLLAWKYRIDRFTVLPLYRLVMRLRGRGSRTQERPVAIATR